MSDAPAGNGAHVSRLTLNTDGKRHPWINAAAAYSVIGGLASFIIGMLNQMHLVGTLLGVTGFVIGMVAQLVSATRVERMFIVFGIVASFVGMGLGFAHGGFGA